MQDSPKSQTSVDRGAFPGRRFSIDRAVNSSVKVESGWRKSRRRAKVWSGMASPGGSSILRSREYMVGAVMPQHKVRFIDRNVSIIRK